MAADPALDRSQTVVCRAAPDASAPPMQGRTATLAARLVEEMATSWRHRLPVRAEDVLRRHPELGEDADLAVRLVYEEVCQRQEGGEQVCPEEILHRFPQWREQLARLMDRRWRLDPGNTLPPEPPQEYRVLAELGHGAHGRVYLATQPALADRPVVLKVTSGFGQEHLSLARLQHTHIVPLYGVHEDAANNVRTLCMPYFGGATWQQVLDDLAPIPPAERTGQDILTMLDRRQDTALVVVSRQGPARERLVEMDYAEAVCWLGACLAEALQYAHERGLVHLDLKPSNVLIAADGQPMLLDFHLAQGPIRPDSPQPLWLGGTHGYMSPEQHRAVTDAQAGRPISAGVDGRSDVYALGVLLYEALTGRRPQAGGQGLVPLRQLNPRVSVGLADLVARCLAADPAARYATAAELAADLRRHLEGRPLHGVPNRSLAERWNKWRRRHPYALPLYILAAMLVGVLLLGCALLADQVREERPAAPQPVESR
jgi:serine/threonine protein kinase